MNTNKAKKVTAILTNDKFSKLQGNKDFLVKMNVANIRTQLATETKNNIEAVEIAKKIGRYMLKGSEYLKSKEGKNELFKAGYEFGYIDFYCDEFKKQKSAIYEYMDLAKLTDEQIKEQTENGIVNKRTIINNCKGIQAENVGKPKTQSFSVTLNKDNKLTTKGVDVLTLDKITLIISELKRIESELTKKATKKATKKTPKVEA